MFAVSEVNSNIGTLSAKFIKKSKADVEEERDIELVPCEELLAGGKHAGESNNPMFDLESLVENERSNYMCPLNIQNITLTGIYDSDAFHYLKIALKGCQLEGDGLCLNEEEVSEQ